MSEEQRVTCSLSEVSKALAVFRETRRDYGDAIRTGNQHWQAELERRMAQAYVETNEQLLNIAMANIAAFTTLKVGLAMSTSVPDVIQDMRAQTIAVWMSNLQQFLPAGWELFPIAVRKEGEA